MIKQMKKKIFEILLTALVSAGIAALQAVAAQYIGHSIPTASPEAAGLYGMIIHGFRRLS